MLGRKIIGAVKLNEAGFDEAILGFGMAMKPRSVELSEWWTTERYTRVLKTATKNAGRGHGHDKFLRMIQTWWHLDLPRFFSQEHATYKVGTVTCSASTMHRITYEPVTLKSFDIGGLGPRDIICLQNLLDRINVAVEQKDLHRAKRMLPESYMLEQIWCANYAVLNTIISQRKGHRLPHWQRLIDSFYEQVDHPEFLVSAMP